VQPTSEQSGALDFAPQAVAWQQAAGTQSESTVQASSPSFTLEPQAMKSRERVMAKNAAAILCMVQERMRPSSDVCKEQSQRSAGDADFRQLRAGPQRKPSPPASWLFRPRSFQGTMATV
jgi:hypothetical protein